ncbi:MAG TPA: PAS domain S-box protein, partial [Flavisolibacter sp.]
EGRMECDDFLRSLYGSRGRELDGTFASWLNVVDAADRANVAREVMACRMTRNYLDVTFRVSIPNDPILYLRATGIIESDASGTPYRMIGTIQDVTERMLSDQAIRASEAFTQGILNSLSSHIAVVARDGLIVRVNQSWRAFADSNEPLRDFEYNEGANYFDACLKSNDPDALMTLAQMKEVLEGARENMYKEYPCHAPDVQRWYCMRVTPFESGGLPLLLIEHQNITERKLAEDKLLSTTRALQQTLHELHKIMDSSPDIICTVDNEGRFISVSAAATHILGYAPGELVGEKYIDFVFGDDIAYTNEVAALLMTGINFTNFENRYVRKNGTVVPILWSAQWDAEDKTIHCIAKDATEKKRLESAFEAEQQRFASLFEQAPSCIGVFKGPEHHFEMANPLFLQITGKKDLIGKPVRTVLPELEGQGVFELLDRVYNTGTSVSGKEIPIKIDRHGTGALLKIYSNFVYQPYTNTLGVVEGIFFFSVDVTEQVLTRKKLEENEKNYSLLFHSSPLPQYISDKKTLRLIEVNAQALKQYGYTRREFLNKTSSDLQLKEHNTARPEVLERSAKANAPFSNLVCHTNKKGDQMLVEIKSSSINYHGIPATLTSVSDMTGEVRLQTKIVDLKIAAQKEITQAHIKGQELERAFIGRELHDNINQQLTTAKLYLDLAKDKEDLRLDLLGKSENVIQNTINEIRSLSKSFMVPT